MVKLWEMKYQFLAKIATADLAFEAYGKTLEELFQNCAQALMEVMVDTKTVKPMSNVPLKARLAKGGKCQMSRQRRGSPKAANVKMEDLLFNFLSELVYLKDAKQLLFSKFEIKIKTLHPKPLGASPRGKPYALVANLWGEKIDPQKHKLRSDVKAVTWHQFKIESKKDGYKARVVLDI